MFHLGTKALCNEPFTNFRGNHMDADMVANGDNMNDDVYIVYEKRNNNAVDDAWVSEKDDDLHYVNSNEKAS